MKKTSTPPLVAPLGMNYSKNTTLAPQIFYSTQSSIRIFHHVLTADQCKLNETRYYIAACMGILALISIIQDTSIVAVISWTNTLRRTPITIFIVFLSTLDIIHTSTILPIKVIVTLRQNLPAYRRPILLLVWASCAPSLICVAILLVLLISSTRCFYPQNSHRLTRKRLTLAFLFLLSILPSALLLCAHLHVLTFSFYGICAVYIGSICTTTALLYATMASKLRYFYTIHLSYPIPLFLFIVLFALLIH